MMNNYSSKKVCLSNSSKIKNNQEATKSLNNYINQLKFHFGLNDKDIIIILESLQKSRKISNPKKKWWQIWK